MEWIVALTILGLIGWVAKKKGNERHIRTALEKNLTVQPEEPVVVEVYATTRQASGPNVVEILNDDGVPEFKYRFRAHLSFDTPAEALRKHWQEAFIPRPNGNRDSISEPGGYWHPVSEWEDPEIALGYEEDQFKYIGGVQVYIDLLLNVRAIYEGTGRSPAEKRTAIERICQEDYSVYTVRHVFAPPWESLLVPVLSLGDGIGPHRVGILETAGIKTISDLRSRSDKQLLEIKGIGKAAVSALRNLSAQWAYDVDTEIIERDAEYRRAVTAISEKQAQDVSGAGV